MTDVSFVLMIVSALGVGAFVLVGGPLVKQVTALLAERTRMHFEDLLISYSPERAVGIATAITVGLAVVHVVVLGSWFLAVCMFVLVPLVAEVGFRVARKKRRQQIDLQLPDTLTTIANSMRSGLTLMQAIEMTRDNSFAPMSKELGIVVSENRMGTSVEDSFDKIAQRVQSPYLDSAVAAIAITRRTGGNVAEGLDRIAGTIREIMRIENQIQAMTSQGRMEGIVMGIMPFVAIGGFYLFDKEMIMPLFTDPIGHCILITIVFCDLIAIVAIKKLMAIDV